MRFVTAFLAISLIVVVVQGKKNCKVHRKQDKAWEDFKQTYNKTYPSACVEKMRKKIFLQNKFEVDQMNRDFCKGKSPFSAKLYPWADLTDDEFHKACQVLE